VSDSASTVSSPSRSGRVLVAGASGALGGRVARRLLASGVPVRAAGRRADALASLAQAGAELFVGDLRDAELARRACAGVTQVVTTMNNVMGTGDNSPVTADRPAYRTLSHAIVEAGVERWVHVSALGIGPNNPVDYFRVKHAVDEMIIASGVPWVLVQPSAFMETWLTTILGDSMRRARKVTLFGRGDRVSNFVAMDDVAAVLCAVLADRSVVDERIPVGGPSTLTWLDTVAAIEQAYDLRVRRSFVPRWLLSIGRGVAGRFDEKVGRLMSLGYWSATTDVRCDAWAETARRFGLAPMSVETYLAAERAAQNTATRSAPAVTS
jgi:NADH dehydrogenase